MKRSKVVHDDTGRTLAPRDFVAYLTGRDIRTVRAHVPVVASSVRTRAALVDVAQADAILSALQTRARR